MSSEPPWRRTPWWHGQAKREWVFFGFLSMCVVVAMIFFLIVVLGHEAQ